MHTIRKLLLISCLGVLLPWVASAQSVSDMRALSPADRRAFMESMSEDERVAMRKKWRAEFDALPEDEKQAIREQRAGQRGNRHRDRAAMRERWASMSDEERAAAKDRHQARKAERRARWDAMSSEEKAAARERRDQRKEQRAHRRHPDRPASED